jgi:hypothetical protein
MQTSQVIFLPMMYVPTYLQMEHFKMLQTELNFMHAQINNESKDSYERMLRKQIFYNKMRERIHLVE